MELYIDSTAQDIATLFAVSRPVVCRWLDTYGIPRRSLSETANVVQSRRSYEDHMRMSAASRAIITGKKRSHADLCKRALGKQRTARMSEYEAELKSALEMAGLGYPVIPLLAVDKYNVDLAIPSRMLAIEVDGGNWHKTAKRKKMQDARKTARIENLGWRIIRVNTRRRDWLSLATSSILSTLRREQS